MTKKLFVAAAASALLVPALALAEVVVVNGEAGMIFKDAPSTITREQVRAEMKAPLAEQHFKYAGGEAGWIHEGPRHRLVVQGESVAHAADCPVMASLNAPKTRPAGANDVAYQGA